MQPASFVTARDTVEVSTPLRSGSRRRAVLAANSVTCDLHVYGADNCLRIFNPKASALRCIQLVRPQLLDHEFLRGAPDFWREPPQVQAERVSQWLGTDGALDMPHEIVEMRLDEASGLVALVGVHRVSVLVLPSPARVTAPVETADDLGRVLSHLGLDEYGSALRAEGYVSVHALLRMNADERARMAVHVGMKPGHAQTLAMHLDGRLPAPPSIPAAGAGASGDEPTLCWAMPVRLSATALGARDAENASAGVPAPSAFRQCRSFTSTPNITASPSMTDAAGALDVVQADWHPLGECHLAVLLSDGTFRLFDVSANVQAPVLTLNVPAESKDGFEDHRSRPAGFCFGAPTHGGWSSLCVYIASSSGTIYIACPVLPGGERARQHVRSLTPQLEASLGDSAACEATRAWLRVSTTSHPPAAPYAQQPPPMLQGPLRMRSTTTSPRERGEHIAFQLGSPVAGRSSAAAMSANQLPRAVALCCRPLAGGLTAVFLGHTDRTVAIAILTGPLTPRWVKASAEPPLVPTSAVPTSAALATPGCRDSLRSSLVAPWASPSSSASRDWRGGRTSMPPRRARSDQTPSRPDATLTITRSGSAPVEVDEAGSAAETLDLLELSTAHLGPASTVAEPVAPEPLRWMKLTADDLSPERLFAHTSNGLLHVIQFPWLHDWARFLQAAPSEEDEAAQSTIPNAPPATCATQQLLESAQPTASAGVVGVAALRDPSLGDALFAMQNDGTCFRLQLELLPRGQVGASPAVGNVADHKVEAHFDVALKQLAHHRHTFGASAGGVNPDDVLWERCRDELESSAPHDAMSAFGRSLVALAGPASSLRSWGALVEETKARALRIGKQAAAQPEEEEALALEIENLGAQVQMLRHKASLAQAVQQNLEVRSRALRTVLRTPVLWPCGGVSEEERRQHRRLLTLRDRVQEGQFALQKLVQEAGNCMTQPGDGWEVDGGAGAPQRSVTPPSLAFNPPQLSFAPEDDQVATDSMGLAEEKAELKLQGDVLEKLVAQLKEAVDQSQHAVTALTAVAAGH